MISLIICIVIVHSFSPETPKRRLLSHFTARDSPRDLLMVSERTRDEFTKSTRRSQEQSGGAGGSASIEGLVALDKAWAKLRDGGWKKMGAKIVSQHSRDLPLTSSDNKIYDVVVCGGT